MQVQAQTQVHTLSVQVSGGEMAVTTYPNGRRKFWWNTHPVSEQEFRRIWKNKRPS